MSHPENRVLAGDAEKSRNFFQSDAILSAYLKKYLTDSAFGYMEQKLDRLGTKAATVMDELSSQADKQPPELVKRTPLGEHADEVKFHPAYWQLVDIAAESEMFYVKYNPEFNKDFDEVRNKLCFGAGQLYAMSELGVYCPLCMTDGAAHLVDKYADTRTRSRLLPKLSAKNGSDLYTGAMFLTEKSGGSDVGANLSEATPIENDFYHLNGEKWFCSNVNADVIMALARTGPLAKGTRGLSLFLVEKFIDGEKKNPLEIVRLKDKLGVRSMATGEVLLTDTIGKRLGEEGQGFNLMAEMINISRIYNSVGAIGASRRAIIEAYQYLKQRFTFGKKAVEHPLVREKFYELGAHYVADFLLVWRTIRAMDAAETGDEEEKDLLRILTPMAKWKSADQGVYTARECMELMGGNGYIEDFVMPRLLRDINVLPIWEGSGNIIVLDILRAAVKSQGMEIIIGEIEATVGKNPEFKKTVKKQLDDLLVVWQKIIAMDDTNAREATAKPLFERLIYLYQVTLLIGERDENNKDWIDPALSYLKKKLDQKVAVSRPPDISEIDRLIAWEF